MRLRMATATFLAFGVFACEVPADQPNDVDDTQVAAPSDTKVPLGSFEMLIDPAAGTATFVDAASSTRGLNAINVVQDGVAGTGPAGSVELVTANTGNGMAACGATDTFCADVTVRTFYTTPISALEVQVNSISPATGHAATNSAMSIHGLDNTLGLFAYGDFDPAGGTTVASVQTWNFGDDGVPYTVRGTVWGDFGVCSSPALAVPDNDPMGVFDTIVVPDLGNVVDLDVSVDMTSTWVGDLIFVVSHDATSVTVMDRPGVPASGFGCSGDNIDMVLDDEAANPVEDECNNLPALSGSLSPNSPLSAFDGQPSAGNWVLTVSDNAQADNHTLDRWCLIFN